MLGEILATVLVTVLVIEIYETSTELCLVCVMVLCIVTDFTAQGKSRDTGNLSTTRKIYTTQTKIMDHFLSLGIYLGCGRMLLHH